MTRTDLRPSPDLNKLPASVEAGSVLTLQELARRLRWKRHSIRQARRLGLPVVRFGSRDYCLTDDVVMWFRTLREQQQKGANV